MASLARTERAALSELFEQVGPDAPTLCEGWTARDLAAHVVIREGRPDALPGIVLSPLSGWTARVQRGAAARDWPAIIDRIRTGPPAWSPMRPRRVDEAANTVEMFVHHEDVRRAQPDWAPRALPAATQDELWRRLPRVATMSLRKVRLGLVLVRRDTGERLVAHTGAPTADLTGEPAELLLYLSGRGDHAVVDVTGEPAAVAALAATALGG